MCVGHGLAGGIAMLGATWSAGQFPTADVRCITFGAPRVGNREFASVFLRLVGITYRVIHEHDPTAHFPSNVRAYRHTRGTVWLHDGKVLLQVRWRVAGSRAKRYCTFHQRRCRISKASTRVGESQNERSARRGRY